MDDLQVLDFVIYNPDCSDEIPNFHIIPVTREELAADIAKAEVKLKDFKDKRGDLKIKLLQ